jgi:hypothetical protein
MMVAVCRFGIIIQVRAVLENIAFCWRTTPTKAEIGSSVILIRKRND